ncbi:MAG: two component regulator three y domain-containing protein [Flammeovirgaceae bacterium]|nr:two component regulator three y domain-containing protein [Flammeovirgaceae bacterium]MBE61806.1 two component regulator three y domain-containing protein [Flammeovirgaceae bacterium]HCX24258.1 two component regulator three y domain-containing protein [Cytophagales bacterium]|tara:strand:+ start:2257 stop:5145 length:2889 start_codon:yes stop_codon:yes gene_type:complete
MMRPVLYLLCLSIVFFAKAQYDYYGFSKIPLTTTFNTNDYDGGIQNWDIKEDKRGFIYVANNFGLLEYDGVSWRRYVVQNNTRLRSVFVDMDGRIYGGGQNQLGYFAPDSTGTLSFISIRDQLDKNSRQLEDVWKIIKYDNSILFSSYEGILKYDGSSLDWMPESFGSSVAYVIGNHLYAHFPETGLSKWNGQRFDHLRGSELLASTSIASILPHKNNSLLIFQANGSIYHYQNDSFSKWNNEASDFLSQSQINVAILLANNTIAIGTQNNGLLIMSTEGKILKHLTKGKGLNNRTVLSLHEDQFNNLWIGLNNGISMIELGSPFSIIDEQSGLPGTGYSAMLHNDHIYLGTSNGLFYQGVQPDPLSIESNQYTLVENSGGQVYNLQNIDDQLLLSHHDGAFIVQNQKAQKIFSEAGVWKFTKAPNSNSLLMGTYDGFYACNPSKSLKFNKLKNFSESSRVFEFLNDSTLFMTHGYKGAYKLSINPLEQEIKKVKFYGSENGFPSNILINVFKLSDELIFAAESGLYKYSGQSDNMIHVAELENYLGANSHVSEMSQDLAGNIYFLSNAGMGYLEKTSFGGYEPHVLEFSRIVKYLSDDLENVSIIDHENVFFGAKEGFIHYNPSVNKVRDQPFQTYIRSVTAKTDRDETLYGGSGQLDIEESELPSLPAYFSSLRFKYAAPFYDGQDDLQFQFLLENFEADWSEWTMATEKEYTNLSQGDYTFKVRAKNVFGELSEIASFTFRVYPPWYRSKIAYISYAIILVTIFGVSMLILDIKHKKDKEALTQNQKRELLKKDNELVEVSKKSEEQISRLKNDKLRAEIDHKNRELATTTMHLINKNEFMLTVRDAIKESGKNGNKDGFKKIVRDIDRNLSEDEGWEQFTKHFDQVHGDFLSNVKKDHPGLTPQEIKLCAYLRMNMTSKEIANLLNISVRGVEISRYRLRKKLNISRDVNLVEYMMEY